MALNPEDPFSGFQHGTVMAFINEKMGRHITGLQFYLQNTSLPWAQAEDNLRIILEDNEISSEVKEACTWGCLALAVRFTHRQDQLHTRRVQWLQNLNKLHKSAAQILASNLTYIREEEEMKRKEVTYTLRLIEAKLEEVQRERNLLRWKLFQAETGLWEQVQANKGASLATASRDETVAGTSTQPAPGVGFYAGPSLQPAPGAGLCAGTSPQPALGAGLCAGTSTQPAPGVGFSAGPSPQPAPGVGFSAGTSPQPAPGAGFSARALRQMTPYWRPSDARPRSALRTKEKGPQEPPTSTYADPTAATSSISHAPAWGWPSV